MFRWVWVLALAAAPAWGQARSYEGREAAALSCAHGLVTTSALLGAGGTVSPADREFASIIAAAILTRYVSGTARQKLAALDALAARETGAQTVARFRVELGRCQRQFPL